MSELKNNDLTYVQKLEKDYLRIEAENEQYKQAFQEIEKIWINREFNDNVAWDMISIVRHILKEND